MFYLSPSPAYRIELRIVLYNAMSIVQAPRTLIVLWPLGLDSADKGVAM